MSNIIKIENGSVFQHERKILSNINLTIDEGEFVYLIGRSGSGKSSLLKTLYGELPATEGRFTIDKFNLNSIKRKEIPYEQPKRRAGKTHNNFMTLYDAAMLSFTSAILAKKNNQHIIS